MKVLVEAREDIKSPWNFELQMVVSHAVMSDVGAGNQIRSSCKNSNAINC